jgi:hypothetical protein
LNKIDKSIFPNARPEKKAHEFAVMSHVWRSLDLVEPHLSGEDGYSHLLITRFDNYYFRPFDVGKLNLEKFNFGWIADVGQCDDNFLLFKKEHAWGLREYVKRSDGYPHGINSNFKNEDNYLCVLDPVSGYDHAEFYVFQRYMKDLKDGKIRLREKY